MMERSQELKTMLEWLATTPTEHALQLDERDLKQLYNHINRGSLVLELKGFLRDFSDTNMRVFQATKMRTETKSKMAEAEALSYFLMFAQKIRNIVHDIVQDDEALDLFEMRIRREILNPVGAKLPDDPQPPPVLGKPIKS
jgi:hypothetical protein